MAANLKPATPAAAGSGQLQPDWTVVTPSPQDLLRSVSGGLQGRSAALLGRGFRRRGPRAASPAASLTGVFLAANPFALDEESER
jgi:hypothetical protein